MGRIARILGIVLLGLLVVLAVVITLTIGWRPIIGPKVRPLTDRKFEATPEHLARGRQLFQGCAGCHSPRDWKPHEPTVLPGMLGAGMVMPIEDLPGAHRRPQSDPRPRNRIGEMD